MYQAFYRKYRPLIFSDVAGQEAVTETLRSQVSQDRLSHAYLFTGTRGTGKTTCAKILARAANCLSPAAGNPCNICAPCAGALEGSLLDVIEIDAASNSGVDNIRSLRDEAAFVPASARKRVYIIDEVHMLSTGAFNALLKTLEEPPPHVLFILATTETHKVPATILSRCQRFAFKRLTEQCIAERLMFISERESLALTPSAAALLARLADGAMRDGVSLLDQSAAMAEGKIDDEQVFRALGLAGDETIGGWAETIARGDAAAAMEVLREQIDLGRDIASLLGELSQSLRGMLLAKLRGTAVKQNDLSAQPTERLLYMLTAVQDALSRMSRSPQPRIEAELCVIKLCGTTPENIPKPKPPSPPTADIAGGGTPPTPTADIAGGGTPPTPTADIAGGGTPPVGRGIPDAPQLKPEPQPEPKPDTQPEPQPPLETTGRPGVRPLRTEPDAESDTEPQPPSPPAADVGTPQDFKQAAAARLPHSLKSFLLNDAVDVERSESLWRVVAPDDITLSRLSQPNAIKAMEEAAGETAGHPVSVRVSLKPEPPKNPKLQMLMDNFDM
ncbi:MAG: DNA polymerase III subunit gamma/tau [Oscillospiraceae bacterium]|nr:DNA polymerase III subunit gamma/tau [Oscillospiraceae bacterium]